MSSVSNIALRYLILSERIIQSQKYYLSSPRRYRFLKSFTNITNKSDCVKRCLIRSNAPYVPLVNFSAKLNPEPKEPQKEKDDSSTEIVDESKLSTWQRLKKMYKEYWYIAVPVHVVTSVGWFGGFYYIASTGFDVVGYMEYFNINEMFIKPFRDSSMGHIAVAYALYKIFTPLRYTVTLGGTTFSIDFLKKRGYIKPVPSSTELKRRFDEKKDQFQEGFRETRKEIKQRKQNISDDIAHYRSEIKSLEGINDSTGTGDKPKK